MVVLCLVYCSAVDNTQIATNAYTPFHLIPRHHRSKCVVGFQDVSNSTDEKWYQRTWNYYVRFQVFTAVIINMRAFWGIATTAAYEQYVKLVAHRKSIKKKLGHIIFMWYAEHFDLVQKQPPSYDHKSNSLILQEWDNSDKIVTHGYKVQ
jgi:hypothetical protein